MHNGRTIAIHPSGKSIWFPCDLDP